MYKYKKYPKYKESGVEWLGKIPEHWELWKMAHAFKTIGSGTTPNSTDNSYYNGFIPWVTTGELRENIITSTKKMLTRKALLQNSSLTLFPKDSIVIAMYGATIGRLGKLGVNATTNQACCVMTNSKVILNSYLYYWLMGNKNEIINLAYGGGQPNISQDTIATLKVSLPETEEQKAIATYLDRATQKIDTLIAKQSSLIALLKEKRQALISHTVTKGLNPDAKMKESGVAWLGEIPAGWEVVQSRRLFQERKGRALKDDEQLTASQKYGVIPQKKFMKIEGRKVTQVLTGSEILKHVEANDFVMSMRSFQGGLEYSAYTGCVSSAYVGLIPIKHVNSTFFRYLFKSKPYIQALQSTSNLVRDGQALRFDNFSKVSLVIVPDKEQETIATYLDQKTQTIDTLITKATEAITLLKEKRTALVSAVVTGKVDVRESA